MNSPHDVDSRVCHKNRIFISISKSGELYNSSLKTACAAADRSVGPMAWEDRLVLKITACYWIRVVIAVKLAVVAALD